MRQLAGRSMATGSTPAISRRLFSYGASSTGSQPGALNVGWNGGHTAATLPDGTPVSSGEGGGVRIGGGGAFQGQFSHHMFLPMAPEEVPPPQAPDAPIVLMAQEAPMAPPPPADPFAPPAPADIAPPA